MLVLRLLILPIAAKMSTPLVTRPIFREWTNNQHLKIWIKTKVKIRKSNLHKGGRRIQVTYQKYHQPLVLRNQINAKRRASLRKKGSIVKKKAATWSLLSKTTNWKRKRMKYSFLALTKSLANQGLDASNASLTPMASSMRTRSPIATCNKNTSNH